MILLKEKYAKYICLITFIFIQLFGYSLTAADPIQCFRCGPSANSTCSKLLIDKLKNCTSDTFKKCYTKIHTNGTIERDCLAESGDNCKPEDNCVATEAGKNNQLVCSKCDASDAKCSQTDMKINEAKYYQICDLNINKCLVKVDNKLVVRSCDSASTQCPEKSTTCKTCSTVNCNTGIFPEERLNCYQCSSCDDVKDVVSKPCALYETEDACYTKGENSTTMTRGCKSDSHDNACSSNDTACAFCPTKDCNDLKYKRVPTLKCHECESTATTINDNCYKEQTAETLKSCAKEILYNETAYCYTKTEEGGIQRGCLPESDPLIADKCKDGEAGSCSKCNQADGCNNKGVEFTCIVCRSDIDKKCWNEADKLDGKLCRGASTAQDGCFQGIWYGVAIRGCRVDASIQDQAICEDEKDPQCSLCFTKDCNTKKSSAVKIGLSYGLMLIVLLAYLVKF